MGRAPLLSAIVLMVCAGSAQATTITYTDLPSFQAASSTTNIDFAGLAPDGDYSYYGSSLTVSGVTFGSPTSDLFVIDADYFADCCAFSNSVAAATLYDDAFNSGVAFTASFSSATALAFDVSNSGLPSSLLPNGGNITLLLSNGFSTTFASSSWPTFFGLTTDTPFTSATISSSDNPSGFNYTELTNFRLGSASPATVPEPASLLLLGTGLIGVGRFRRRSR